MAILRCKSCGGELDFVEGQSVVECNYCGNKQTLPKTVDSDVQEMFNNANTLRQKCEFDKAEKLYEKVLAKNPEEAEAYWGIVLCNFGIEYVKDPGTEKRIPTCHRVSYDSVVADDNYKQAVKYADALQKSVYENDARTIDDIQKRILAMSLNEERYDVFICYKETDDITKMRTQDSVAANDIYYQLTNEGYKVFYAAITLEGKLGEEYEPIIFSALNSAKVMLVVGSKPEYFQAVWVRNEWSRYLKLMKKDRSRLLIPCYKGMDAYNLPEEFAHLQAQDMSKIGFINDLVRGIQKVIVKDTPKATATAAPAASYGANSSVAPLLKRTFIFLEDGDWDSADEYCEKVLDQDPENAQAYLGKLMSELHVRRKEQLKNCAESFERNRYYEKAIRYADASLASELKGYIAFINDRNAKQAEEERKASEEARKSREYNAAINGYNTSSIDLVRRSHQIFVSLDNYKDAANYAFLCQQKIEDLRIQEENERREEERRQQLIASKNNELAPLIRTKSDISIKLQRAEDIESKISATKYEINNFKTLGRETQKARRKAILRQIIFILFQFVALVLIVATSVMPKLSNFSAAFLPFMLIGFIGGVISTGLLAKFEGDKHPVIWGIATYMSFGIAGIVYLFKSIKKLFKQTNAQGKTKSDLQRDLAMYEKQITAFGPNAVFNLKKAIADIDSEIRICNAKYDAMINNV